MKLTGKILLLKIITIFLGVAGSMLGIRFLFFPAIPLLDRPFNFLATVNSSHEEALMNSTAIGLFILIPSLIFMVCSVWFGMGIKWYYWSIGRHPLIISIFLMIVGAITYFSNPQFSNVSLAVMGGGVLGAIISYVFLQIDRIYFSKK